MNQSNPWKKDSNLTPTPPPVNPWKKADQTPPVAPPKPAEIPRAPVEAPKIVEAPNPVTASPF